MPSKKPSPKVGKKSAAAAKAPVARQAVIYARVSSKEQEDEGFSIPSQLKLLREYARKSGFVVAQEYIDTETAKRVGRTHFSEMVNFLSKSAATGKCSVVLVEKTDRLYRNLKDYVTIEELDIEVHLVKEGAILSSTSRSNDRFMHGIKVLMARNYIDNLSEEARKGQLEKAQQGIWPGLAPMGYRNVMGPNGKRIIEVDPDTGPHVERLFERYATGAHSAAELARQAYADGLVYRKSKQKIPANTITHLLRNRLYCGEIEWHGQTYLATHKALVSRELWEKVQAMLDGRHSGGGPVAGADLHLHMFRGLVHCGKCALLLSPTAVRDKYIYYRCPRCPKMYVREEDIDREFLKALGTLRLDDEILGELVQGLKESLVDETRFHAEALAALTTQYERLQKRLEGLYQDKLDGEVDLEMYRRKSTEWRTEQSEVLRQMENHQKADQNYLDEGVSLLELMQHLESTYKTAQSVEKRDILKFLIANSQWADGILTVEFRKPFSYIAEAVKRSEGGNDENGGDSGGSAIAPG